LGVIGFVIFLMSLISLIVLIGENLRLPLPQFGYKREQILFFFLGESFFLTLLTMAVYTKRSLEFTEAGLRFGIYIVLLGAFFGALSAFALIQKKKNKEVQEFFAHEQEAEDGEVEKAESTEEEVEVKEEMTQTEPEPMYFEEDAQAIEAAEETVESKTSDYIIEDDMIEDVKDIPRDDQNQTGKATKDSTDVKGKQGNYFTREAGVGNDEDKPKSGSSMSMDFYKDK
jgi:hypothetical protein